MDQTNKSYVNWLYHVPGLGRKKLELILSRGYSARELYEMSGREWLFFLREECKFTEKQAEKLRLEIERLRKRKSPKELLEEINKKKIIFLLSEDEEYPKRLREIPDKPYALYMKGNPDALRKLSEKSIAIIGARECSEYGKRVAQQFGKECAGKGIPVVSGMAYGVDGIAQKAAVLEGGISAAVLGCGVDLCYPPSNRELYERLINNGCVLSEYIPGTEPKPGNFPPRNRIISGIADALIVVEAKEKSGSMITVDMALEQGREVYVVPGRVSDPMSSGCNRLIRQGASVVCDVQETLDEIVGEVADRGLHNFAEKNSKKNPCEERTLRACIYRTLDMHPKSVQQIFEEVTDAGAIVNISQLQTELFYMQMEGQIWEQGGRYGTG